MTLTSVDPLLEEFADYRLPGVPAAPAPHPTEGPGALVLSRLKSGAEVLDVPQPEPLLEGWLDRRSVALFWGPPAVYKSFALLGLGLAVAQGFSDWADVPLHASGAVLYVAAEGAYTMPDRVRAWCAHHKVPRPPEDFHLFDEAVDLRDKRWVAEFVAASLQLDARLIILDTVNRLMPGGDENSAADMGSFFDAAARMRDTGACVAACHHTGKDPRNGARGHSLLPANIDVSIEASRGGDSIVELRCHKQKVRALPRPLRLETREVPPTTSVVLVPSASVGSSAAAAMIEEEVADFLKSAIAPASRDEIRAAVHRRMTSVTQALDVLIREGKVTKQTVPRTGGGKGPATVEVFEWI